MNGFQPQANIVRLAIEASKCSPCRSKRGVAIFRDGNLVSTGHNHKPRPFACDGSVTCKMSCRVNAIHAEQHALLSAGHAQGADMLHVKTVDGVLVASGGPSCVECSKLIVAAGIDGMWLYNGDGWRRYKAEEFHALSSKAAEAAKIAERCQCGCLRVAHEERMGLSENLNITPGCRTCQCSGFVSNDPLVIAHDRIANMYARGAELEAQIKAAERVLIDAGMQPTGDLSMDLQTLVYAYRRDKEELSSIRFDNTKLERRVSRVVDAWDAASDREIDCRMLLKEVTAKIAALLAAQAENGRFTGESTAVEYPTPQGQRIDDRPAGSAPLNTAGTSEPADRSHSLNTDESWVSLPEGAWFYGYSPGCAIPHSVMERTSNGYRAVCHPAWNTPYDERNMRLIAELRQKADDWYTWVKESLVEKSGG